MKKVLSLVLALTMILGSFSFVSAADFADVTDPALKQATDRLELLEILQGYPDGTFKPEQTITRAEFAAVAVRAKGLESAATAAKGLATGFTDVTTGHWASGYVGTAAKLGVVNGVGAGLFAPEAPVKYEEAVTMIVRALGYEPSAQAKGGYPYGYLIVANEIGLLDAVKGTQGAPASRGTVAQIADNALEIPVMIQIGFGTDTKWVVSGTENTKEKYLLDELGFDAVEGRADVSSNKKKITVNIEDKDEQDRVGKKSVTIDVNNNVDLYEVNGQLTKFWYKNNVVAFYAVQEEAKYDAVKYDEKEKVELVTEDEEYEVAKNADLVLDGDDVDVEDFIADYAKVVLNDDDEIIWAEGYTFDGFIVVEEVKDNEIIGYEEDELNIKGYTIVKDGKTLAAEDLEDGDVVFYNNDEDFAVVTTLTKTGKIDRVYTDGFRFDGTTYTVSAIGTKYFDGTDLIDLDADLLEELEEDEDEVTLFFNFAKKVAVVSGVDKDVNSSTFYAVLTDTVEISVGRRGQTYVSVDVRTQANAKQSYDLDFDVLKDSGLLTAAQKGAFEALDGSDDYTNDIFPLFGLNPTQAFDDAGDVLKITVDEDGEVTKIFIPENSELTKDFKVTDKYVKAGSDFKATSSTAVFYNENKKAIKLGDVKDEFEVVKEGTTPNKSVVFFDKGNAVAIVGETDADADTKTVVGLLTGVRELNSGAFEFKVKVAGKSETYVTDGTTGTLTGTGITKTSKDVIVELEIGEKSGKVAVDSNKKIEISVSTNTVVVDEVLSISGRKVSTHTVVGDVYKEYSLVDGYKIYDSNDNYAEVKSARDLIGESATLYFDASSNYYVAYIVVGLTDNGALNSTLEAIYPATNTIKIEGKLYQYNGDVNDFAGLVGQEVTFKTQTLNGVVYVYDVVAK